MTSSENLTVLANNVTGKEFVSLGSSLHPGVKSAVIFLSIIMMVFGVSANFFVLSVKVQQLRCKMTRSQIAFRRSATSYLMISISISDILTAIFRPIIMIIDMLVQGMHREWSCKISRFFSVLSFTLIARNIFLISIEQHLCVFHWRWLPSPLFIKRAIVFFWIEAFIISLTSFAYASPEIIDLNSFQYTVACKLDLHQPHSLELYIFYFLKVYAIPLFFMSYSAFSIYQFTRKQKPSNLTVIQKHKFKKTRMFTNNIFYAFVLPYSLFVVYMVIAMFIPKKSAQIDLSFRYFGALLSFSNCCINPLIYFIKSSVCRKMLMEKLSMIWQRVRCAKNKVNQQ